MNLYYIQFPLSHENVFFLFKIIDVTMILRTILNLKNYFFRLKLAPLMMVQKYLTLDTTSTIKKIPRGNFVPSDKTKEYTKNERFSLKQTDLVHAFTYSCFYNAVQVYSFQQSPNCSVSASYLAIVSSLIVARRAVFAMTVATETASGCVTNATAFPAQRFSFVIYPFGIVHVAVRFESCTLQLN